MDPVQPLAEHGRDLTLVVRIDVGEQQADGHRFHLGLRDRARDSVELGGIELGYDTARGHALTRADAQAVVDEGWRASLA